MKKLGNLLKGDTVVWVVFFALSAISLIAVYSSVGQMAIPKYGSATPVFFRHLGVVLATYLAIILLSNIPYQRFYNLSIPCYWAAVVLLIMVLAIGHDRRWFAVPIISSFQPSEMAKVLLIVFTARILVGLKDDIKSAKSLVLSLIPGAIVAALVLPGNFSTAVLIFLSCFIMVRFGGVNPRYWNLTAAIGCIGILLILYILYRWGDQIDLFRSSIWQARLEQWLHPQYDDITQENMAKMAIARGKIFGSGIGSTVHARLMTEAYNDFIYAIIIEESGMIGGLVVFMLYGIFYFRCIKIAVKCQGLFGALIVAGLGTLIILQAMTNMCVAVGMLPVTGQTLPFVSYGGTSYLFLGSSIGIIQSVANSNNRKQKKTQTTQTI